MDKKTILKNVKAVSNSEDKFIEEVKAFCKEILREASVDMELLVVKDREYRIVTTESNVGTERHVVVRDWRSERSFNFATFEGGSFYMHKDFNCLVRRANWEDCVSLVDDFATYFADNAKKTLEKIRERAKFFTVD